MKMVIGLGNPGDKYVRTRHNSGSMVVDEISGRLGIKVTRQECFSLLGSGKEVLLAKPQTFMNNSGEAAVCLLKKFEIGTQDLIVIYDDIDLPLGKIRIRSGGTSGGHHGIDSIIEHLGNPDFLRIRVGISGEKKPADAVRFVLSEFAKAEKPMLKESVIKAADAAVFLLSNTVEAAMNRFN
jgi:peptidyl-tRNA hydrolase, PTH1 family